MGEVTLNPYIFFQGNSREAMEFYKGIFGGELTVQTYDESPGDFPGKEQMKGKIMHADLSGGDARLMGSDTQEASAVAKKVSLSLSGSDEPKLRKIFDSLGTSGKISQPLQKAPWGDTFGALVDKFGVEWMMNINAKK
jgi:PhnB protein